MSACCGGCGAEAAAAPTFQGSAPRSRALAEAKAQFCFVGEEIEITFSYWDGSGHRRTVKVGRVGLAPRSPGAPLEGAFFFF